MSFRIFLKKIKVFIKIPGVFPEFSGFLRSGGDFGVDFQIPHIFPRRMVYLSSKSEPWGPESVHFTKSQKSAGYFRRGLYKEQLHSSCDFVLKNFDIRQTARDEEIEALKQAKAILSGAKFEAFLQSDW